MRERAHEFENHVGDFLFVFVARHINDRVEKRFILFYVLALIRALHIFDKQNPEIELPVVSVLVVRNIIFARPSVIFARFLAAKPVQRHRIKIGDRHEFVYRRETCARFPFLHGLTSYVQLFGKLFLSHLFRRSQRRKFFRKHNFTSVLRILRYDYNSRGIKNQPSAGSNFRNRRLLFFRALCRSLRFSQRFL